MKRTIKNLRTTSKDDDTNLDNNLPHDPAAKCEVFCFAALADQTTGTIYTDLTGRFPVRSLHSNQCIFLAYVYDANAILVRPMKTRETPSMLKAFKDIYEHLEAINMQPKLHIMDNECSRKIQNYITTNRDTKIQFVKANSHRFNSAERAIHTFKNYFIAGLCTFHKKIPLLLWCQLLQQAEISLNLLRASRTNPKLSAYVIVEGEFNFNKTPLAPPGTKALIFDSPTTRKTLVRWIYHHRETVIFHLL